MKRHTKYKPRFLFLDSTYINYWHIAFKVSKCSLSTQNLFPYGLGFKTFKEDSFHMPARLCSKSFNIGFSSMWTENFQMYKLDLEKAEKPEIKLPNVFHRFCWIYEKAREFQKNIYFCFTDYTKAFDCVDHNKLWKILKEVEYRTTWPASWEICMQVKKQQLELDMEQLVPNWERSTLRLYTVTLLI